MSGFKIESDKFYGKYRAQVVDVDDPKKRGRILVSSESILPSIAELGWAESCLPPGTFFLPRKGDFVWIEFEEGDVTLPIWVGIMPTREYVKSYLFEGMSDRTNYDPYITIIRTPQHKVMFHNDDLKGEKAIKILDSAGSTLHFNSNTGDVSLRATDILNAVAGFTLITGEGTTESYTSKGSVKPIKPMESGD